MPVVDQLFPAPSLPPSPLSPQRLPGASPESLAALQDVLKDNHQRHHIFFNDLHFNNHISRRALAIYALGGSAAIIREYYERDSCIQRPAFSSPGSITEENFVDHLGDENFYQAYVSFFSKQVSEKGAGSTLEEFVFSEKYNFEKGRETDQPEMLARFFSSLLHPLIHTGYGVEFGMKGMLVEGLGLLAVQGVQLKGVLTSSLFPPSSSIDVVEHGVNHFPSLALNVPVTRTPLVSKTGGVHAFDIVTRILNDDRFDGRTPADFSNKFMEMFAENAAMVIEHAERWTIDLNQPGEVERKMEEVIWLSSSVYAAGGMTANGFRPDFYLMHTVNSSLFLPSHIAYLSPRSQVLLLRGYFYIVLTWWTMRGRPALNIKSLLTTTSLEPSIPTAPTQKMPFTAETTSTPNPFLPVLQSAITHPNDHLIKIQRSFAHFDSIYGRRSAGYFKGTELEDAELLDGSLFLRASLLTADYVGWVREGREAAQFSFEGFFRA